MGANARQLGTCVAVMSLLAVPIAAHFAVVAHRGTELAGWLIALQAALAGWLVITLAAASAVSARPARWRVIRLGICAVLFGCTLMASRQWGGGLVLAAAVPHAVVYLGLLAVFAASLAPGRQAVITIVARRIRGTLNDELTGYTRRVTGMWCVFFTAQLAVSAALGLWAPLAWWSIFINVCNFPLVLLMFGAELAYRHWRHGIFMPGAPPGFPRQMKLVMRQVRSPFRNVEP